MVNSLTTMIHHIRDWNQAGLVEIISKAPVHNRTVAKVKILS